MPRAVVDKRRIKLRKPAIRNHTVARLATTTTNSRLCHSQRTIFGREIIVSKLRVRASQDLESRTSLADRCPFRQIPVSE